MALYNISTYSQYTEVLIGFMLCQTTSNLPSNCSNRAFFIFVPSACDGRRRGDPNGSPKHARSYTVSESEKMRLVIGRIRKMAEIDSKVWFI